MSTYFEKNIYHCKQVRISALNTIIHHFLMSSIKLLIVGHTYMRDKTRIQLTPKVAGQ